LILFCSVAHTDLLLHAITSFHTCLLSPLVATHSLNVQGKKEKRLTMPKAPSNKRSHVRHYGCFVHNLMAKRNDRSVTTAANTNLITPNTQMGQFLEESRCNCYYSKAGVKSTDTVLEIGPGGYMTVPLLQQSKNVVALEMDGRMVRGSPETRRTHGPVAQTKVIQETPFVPNGPFRPRGNLPYQISSSVVFKLLSHRPMFRCAVVCFRKNLLFD
jgi:18S rRNA (adenine1779-N6/adenine1780-N6)-dimethyltransferase